MSNSAYCIICSKLTDSQIQIINRVLATHAKGYLKSFVFYELLESVYNEKIAFFIIVTNVSSMEPSIRSYTLFCSFGVIQVAYWWKWKSENC